MARETQVELTRPGRESTHLPMSAHSVRMFHVRQSAKQQHVELEGCAGLRLERRGFRAANSIRDCGLGGSEPLLFSTVGIRSDAVCTCLSIEAE